MCVHTRVCACVCVFNSQVLQTGQPSEDISRKKANDILSHFSEEVVQQEEVGLVHALNKSMKTQIKYSQFREVGTALEDPTLHFLYLIAV